MQIQTKLGGILYNRGGKPGSNYLDLELGKEFWNRVRVLGSDYKSRLQTYKVTNRGNQKQHLAVYHWDDVTNRF